MAIYNTGSALHSLSHDRLLHTLLYDHGHSQARNQTKDVQVHHLELQEDIGHHLLPPIFVESVGAELLHQELRQELHSQLSIQTTTPLRITHGTESIEMQKTQTPLHPVLPQEATLQSLTESSSTRAQMFVLQMTSVTSSKAQLLHRPQNNLSS